MCSDAGDGFKYSMIRVIVCEGEPESPKQVVGSQYLGNRDVYVECKLIGGRSYFIYTEITWRQFINNEVVLSVNTETAEI